MGSGRPKGSLNKRTLEFQAILEKHNFCPASSLIHVYKEAMKIYSGYAVIYEAIVKARSEAAGYPVPTEQQAHVYLKIAKDAAEELASYTYAKRKALETSVDQSALDALRAMEGKSEAELRALAAEYLKANPSTGKSRA